LIFRIFLVVFFYLTGFYHFLQFFFVVFKAKFATAEMREILIAAYI